MVTPMTPEQILVIANAPTTPTFVFGSQELSDWNEQHCHAGKCHIWLLSASWCDTPWMEVVPAEPAVEDRQVAWAGLG